jgi:hypothetical protein
VLEEVLSGAMANGKPGRPKGSTIDPAARRSRGNLAMLLRDRVHEEVIMKWLLMILQGKNPKIVEDARCTTTGGLDVVEDLDALGKPSPERQDQAMRELLNRRDGLPAQRVQLEAELRTLHVTGHISAADLAALSPAALGRIAATLRGAIASSSALPDRDESDGGDEGEVAVIAGPPPADAIEATTKT